MDDERLAALVDVLKREPDVVVAYLFGSQARGTTGPLSDVDVGVLLEGEPDLKRHLQVLRVVKRALGRDDVDVVLLNDAPTGLAFDVIGGRLLLSRDEERRITWEARTSMVFLDRQHATRRHLDAAAKRLRERGFG